MEKIFYKRLEYLPTRIFKQTTMKNTNDILDLEQIKLDIEYKEILNTLSDVNQTDSVYREAHVDKIKIEAKMEQLNELKKAINE